MFRKVTPLIQMLLKTHHLGDTNDLDFAYDQHGKKRKENYCKSICTPFIDTVTLVTFARKLSKKEHATMMHDVL